MAELVTPSPAEWDAFVSRHPRAHVLQQSAWGELKRAYGWSVERVAISEDGRIIAGAQMLFRRLPLRLGALAYLGMGPLTTSAASSAALWPAIHACARRHRAVFIKWEPGIYTNDDDAARPDPAMLGFSASAQPVQPPRTVLIDIAADEETILARMNQGTRRKIRQSQKHGVRCWQGSRSDVAAFGQMMQITGARNAFGVHEPGYYALAYDLFVPTGDATLILAEHAGDLLAGVMVFAKGATAWYLYGASSDVKRNLMGAYAAQWAALQWARARGCAIYDMWGVPDEDEAALEAQFESRSDGLWGVYGFKRGWGGRVVRSLGAWDKPYSAPLYAAYRLALGWRG